MVVKAAHRLVKNDVVIVRDRFGATLASRVVIMARSLGRGVHVKFADGSSRTYRRSERVSL